MTGLEKKRQLEGLIKAAVLPKIDRDYVLYGLPYYNNVGDTLIWNGELELLKHTPYKCKGVCAWNGYPKKKLPNDVMIIVTGGGYFGDVWRFAWQQVLDSIILNKNHKILVMPCSIFYEDENLLKSDAEYLSGFPNLTILTRDKASYDYARRYFRNEIELVPDMAFCMSEKYLKKKSAIVPQKHCLFLSRNDKEKTVSKLSMASGTCDVHDWLPMEKVLPKEIFFNRCMGVAWRLGKISHKLQEKLEHYLYRTIYRKHITDSGTDQIASYEAIVSTRLHAMVLALMLERPVEFIDNSYGKIGAYYNTWLTDCEIVKPISSSLQS